MNEVEFNLRALVLAGDNPSKLWEMARQGFMDKGRGAIVMDDNTLDDKRYWHYFNHEMLMDLPTLDLKHIHNVNTYNPLTEFVFIYCCKDGVIGGIIN
jgi:hypothetical protein